METPIPCSRGTEIPVAKAFRNQVTRVLGEAEPLVRQGMRGHYVFSIDGKPSFVVELASTHASSGEIPDSFSSNKLSSGNSECQTVFALEAFDGQACSFSKPISTAGLVLGARVHVTTDSLTLQRLLLGTMKAKKAFLSGKVRIEGDLPIFLRLVGFLKDNGVQPPGESEESLLANQIQRPADFQTSV